MEAADNSDQSPPTHLLQPLAIHIHYSTPAHNHAIILTGVFMRYVVDQGEVKPATEAVIIPLDSARDRCALLSIGDQWSSLLMPTSASSALPQNLVALNSALSEVDRFSLIRAISSPPEYPSIVGYIDTIVGYIDTTPLKLYEARLIVSVAREIAGPDMRVLEDADELIVRCPFGEIGLFREQRSHGLLIASLGVAVHDRDAYRAFLTQVEQRDDALAAGKQFAAALKIAAETMQDFELAGTSVELGSYTFRGPDAREAVEAFFSRNIPDLNRQVSLEGQNFLETFFSQNIPDVTRQVTPEGENILATIAGRVVKRRVTEIIPANCYEIRGDFISYRLSCASDGAIVVAARIIPNQLARDSGHWFASSEAAKEISSILFATGIGRIIPRLVEHAAEADTSLRFGNGYASLSRMICGMISEARHEDRTYLRQLDELFNGTLTSTLLHFRDMSRLESTRLIIDLLVGAIGSAAAHSAHPSFVSPDRDDRLNVNSCDDAEGYFVQAVETGCYSVDSYFLHKTSGEKTSLTRVPILVDGAVIPQGTLCYVKKSGDTIEWVEPVRLTLFNLPLDGEGSEVFRHHLDKMGDARGDNDAAVHAVYRLLHEKS